MLCDDPEDGAVAGERPKREGLYAYIELGYVFRQQKLNNTAKQLYSNYNFFLKRGPRTSSNGSQQRRQRWNRAREEKSR